MILDRTVRVRCRVRLVRRPSSLSNTVVVPSAATGRASPCRTATLAAAASRVSVLRRPRESSRTRAVAVAGTSRTVSPRASSHWERWRPSPRRSSPPTVAHRSALPRSTACGSRAGGLDPDPTSIAEAVWLDLCGSMPITITETCPSGERESIAGAPWSTIRLQPGSRSHTSVESGHGSCRARPQTPGEPTRTGRQEAHERSRARHLRQATTSEHPVRRTGAPIQVGSSAQVCPVSGGVRVDPLLCGAPSPDHPAVTGSIG
jgi:hypothetical protein